MRTDVKNPTVKPRSGEGVVDALEMKARVNEILNRWPTVGLALGVVRDGRLAFFHGHGLADIASNTPITEDTVFRIASITKTFTAIAVMQLWEQGLVDLDAPANDYLRAYKLIPAKNSFRSATVRHLLTHTAGIREVLHPELWGDLCGWYHFSAHPTNPGKLALGAGVEVFVRSGQLRMRYLSPIPALYRGFPLHPDDDTDPYVFRIDFSTFGIEAARVIFSRERGAGTTAVHLDFGPLSFQKQPAIKNPRLWITGALSALAMASAATAVRRRHRSNKGV